ncbi:sigma-70 family RNA polymerase sigma factor [Shewanella sedimentimangrovi]|uniref:Sigma-70 family RNA polymerase sigma factor n=1 Tax=Shewanella sedimentimangrovi TaxID=2814293 RepID=A0ABX7QXH7_9GAMM|nr:sigma-70 family RNA polymerase sigma factor [Shewanella sedimentimangrovi]QSX36213.1 sigma-70 family RNA polymerase sigma factor [Shewanella sedimentimangrovi]
MTALSAVARDTQSDESLMLDYAGGDIRAFECLYLRHKGGLYRFFVRQLGDKQLAEDLYQETWGRVIKAAAGYRVSAKFTTWLYRIAHNLLIDHVRAVKPLEQLQELELEPVCDANTPESAAQQQQQALALKLCIGRLPTVQKEAFLLSSEMGLTAQAISEIAGVSLEACKSRIRYAYQSLRQCLNRRLQESVDEIL